MNSPRFVSFLTFLTSLVQASAVRAEDDSTIPNPDYLRVAIDKQHLRVEFAWYNKPVFPDMPGGTSVEFEISRRAASHRCRHPRHQDRRLHAIASARSQLLPPSGAGTSSVWPMAPGRGHHQKSPV